MTNYIYIPDMKEYNRFIKVSEGNAGEFLIKKRKRFYVYSDCRLLIVIEHPGRNSVELIVQSETLVSNNEAMESYQSVFDRIGEHLKQRKTFIGRDEKIILLVDVLHDEILAVNGEPIEGLFSRYPPYCHEDNQRVIFYYEKENLLTPEEPHVIKFETYLQMYGFSNLVTLQLRNPFLLKIEESPSLATLSWILKIIAKTSGFPKISPNKLLHCKKYFKGGISSDQKTIQPTGEIKRILKVGTLPIKVTSADELEIEDEEEINKEFAYAKTLDEVLKGKLIPDAGDLLIDIPISGKVIGVSAYEGDLIISAQAGITHAELEEQLGISEFCLSYLIT